MQDRELMLKKIKDLPLGTRFRYPGSTSLWVLLEHRGSFGLGLIAEWTGLERPALWPKGVPHQSLCCIVDETQGDVMEFEVEVREEDN